MNLDAVRAELPVLDRLAYLNTGSFGPLPRRTVEVMAEQQRVELEEGRSGHGYWEVIHEVRTATRAALAEVLGAPEDSVALARSTTEGCNIVVAGLGLSAGDEVITTDDEHFGLLGALHVAGVRRPCGRHPRSIGRRDHHGDRGPAERRGPASSPSPTSPGRRGVCCPSGRSPRSAETRAFRCSSTGRRA